MKLRCRIISPTRHCKLIEIKSYSDAPEITDISIIPEGGEPAENPIITMENYGKRLLSALKKDNINLIMKGYLLLKNKNRNKISTKWKSQCVTKEELVNLLRKEASTKHLTLTLNTMLDIREKHICSSGITPFIGFTFEDFTMLSQYKKYAKERKDRQYVADILYSLYHQFRSLATEIRSDFRSEEIILFQHIMSPIQTFPKPIYWAAFTLLDSFNFLTEPQLAFHLSAKDWYGIDFGSGKHFSIKLAFFESSEWMRKLLEKFRMEPSRIIQIIRDFLISEDYRFVVSKNPNDLYINVPVSAHNLTEYFEDVATLVCDECQKIRSVGFEKPFYIDNNENLLTKDNIKTVIKENFLLLYKFLMSILPEYKSIVKNKKYIF